MAQKKSIVPSGQNKLIVKWNEGEQSLSTEEKF